VFLIRGPSETGVHPIEPRDYGVFWFKIMEFKLRFKLANSTIAVCPMKWDDELACMRRLCTWFADEKQ
jgi:hypothetical protein